MKTIKELYQEGSLEGKTLLGVGPVTSNTILETLTVAKANNALAIFIASRNQVDCDKFGGGYILGGMNQEKFVKTINSLKNDTTPVYICRDHGGPWQRNAELDEQYSVKKAMKIAKKSFKADIKAGFNYLHIDPTKCPFEHTMDDIIKWTVELVKYCEKVAKKENKKVEYEVGTEDIQGGLTSPVKFENFIMDLILSLDCYNLPRPTMIVGQTGSLVKNGTNVGTFNIAETKVLVEIAKKYGIGFKEHNADYFLSATCAKHPNIGILGMNVAPEFGHIETNALIEMAEYEHLAFRQGIIENKTESNFIEILKKKTLDAPWKKWITEEVREKFFGQKYLENLIERVCGHYVYDDEEVEKAKNILRYNIESYYNIQLANEKLFERIDNYYKSLNMKDIEC